MLQVQSKPNGLVLFSVLPNAAGDCTFPDPGQMAPKCTGSTSPNYFAQLESSPLANILPIFLPVAVSIIVLITIMCCCCGLHIILRRKRSKQYDDDESDTAIYILGDPFAFDNFLYIKWYPSYKSSMSSVSMVDNHETISTALYDECWSQPDTCWNDRNILTNFKNRWYQYYDVWRAIFSHAIVFKNMTSLYYSVQGRSLEISSGGKNFFDYTKVFPRNFTKFGKFWTAPLPPPLRRLRPWCT